MAAKKWSAKVTKTSDAMDLKKGVFTQASPKAIAKSVKKSATKSDRRKATPERSAMSMLTFYQNRAGKNLSAAQEEEAAKGEGRITEIAGMTEN